MRKAIGCLVVSTMACFFVATYAAEKKRDTEKYDQWLKEEVKLLISAEEEDQFKKLKSNEERDRFIEIFWAKRDPSPGTKENEFKNEWYRRLEYVTKTYNTGPRKGWHCDMGRVYMFFGPPLQTASLGPQTRSVSIGGSQLEGAPEIWTYQPMPDLGLNESFRVQFSSFQGVYDLGQETTQNVRRALELFPTKVIFNPDLEELPRYKFYFDPSSFEGKLIKDFMTTGEEIKQISLEWKPIFTRALNKSTYVSFLIQIDPQQIDKKKFKEVTVFGKIKGEQDEEDFLKSVNTESEIEGKLLAIAGLPANPGKFTLYLGVRDKDKDKYTLLKSDLEVQNLWNDELSTSSLILSPDVTAASGSDREEEFNPYIVGQYKAIPRWGNVFKQSEFLNVLFQVYNAKLENEKVSLAIDYFIVSSQVSYKLNPQEINEKIDPEKALAGGTQIPLSPLKPGIYTFKIKITDKIANKTIEKSVDFTVQ